MIVKIPFCHLKALSSDLLKGEVRLTFQFALNADTMALREKLAMLEVLGTPVDLDIKSPQNSLPGFQSPLPDSFAEQRLGNNITEDGFGETLASDEFKSGVEKAATLVYENRAQAHEPGFASQIMDRVMDELEAGKDAPAPAERGRKGHGGTTTISHNGKSATMTNKAFSRAAKRIEAESRAAVAHTKKKN